MKKSLVIGLIIIIFVIAVFAFIAFTSENPAFSPKGQLDEVKAYKYFDEQDFVEFIKNQQRLGQFPIESTDEPDVDEELVGIMAGLLVNAGIRLAIICSDVGKYCNDYCEAHCKDGPPFCGLFCVIECGNRWNDICDALKIWND
jgi:hypothetical protein